MGAKRKRKSRKRRYTSTYQKPKWQNKPVPDELFEAYKVASDKAAEAENGWCDVPKEDYNRFRDLSNKFLGKYADDEGIDFDRLFICLIKMKRGTMNRDFSYKEND